MAKTSSTNKTRPAAARRANPFEAKKPDTAAREAQGEVHVFGRGAVCDTESRGHSTPRGLSPLEIVLDASEGFIPLWAKNTTLRWRFRESTMKYFERPVAAKAEIRKLFAESILAWGTAVPVKFAERQDAWDFEIVMRKNDDCDANGCVLASAFFPDGGRHTLDLYPQMFAQTRKEQIETMVHEIGHVFGLRHFFANVSEKAWPSQIFGTHKPFSIMNYGNKSVLTPEDSADLKRVYQMSWSGQLTKINGTPIKLVKPFHTIGAPSGLVASSPIDPTFQPKAAYVEVGFE